LVSLHIDGRLVRSELGPWKPEVLAGISFAARSVAQQSQACFHGPPQPAPRPSLIRSTADDSAAPARMFLFLALGLAALSWTPMNRTSRLVTHCWNCVSPRASIIGTRRAAMVRAKE